MTIREFVEGNFRGLEITDAMLIGAGIEDVEEDFDGVTTTIATALCEICKQMMFAPIRTNISENGFSESWSTDRLGKYYLYLCRRYGIKPDPDVLPSSGESRITDRTANW